MTELEEKQPISYMQFIQYAVEVLVKEIEKHVPNIRDIKYGEYNLNDYKEHESIFHQRMQMGLYIELVLAGVIK